MSVPDLELNGLPDDFDSNRIGISYSGGGPLLLIELAIARAFVELGIQPAAIAGVSAGAIAGAAHAFDPVNGTAITAAANALVTLSDAKLGLTRIEMIERVAGALFRMHRLPDSLGDNGPLQDLIEHVFEGLGANPQIKIGDFGKDGRVKLYIGATDRLAGKRTWLDDTVEVADGLVASSAIPGVFPPRAITCDGALKLFVDGAVAQNQPLSQLVSASGCGTLYACAVGYDGQTLNAPADLLDNALTSVSIVAHESSRLEQAYVEQVLGTRGTVTHVHPDGQYPINGFNFTQAQVDDIMGRACEDTKTFLRANMPAGVQAPPAPAPPPAPVPVGAGATPNGGQRT